MLACYCSNTAVQLTNKVRRINNMRSQCLDSHGNKTIRCWQITVLQSFPVLSFIGHIAWPRDSKSRSLGASVSGQVKSSPDTGHLTMVTVISNWIAGCHQIEVKMVLGGKVLQLMSEHVWRDHWQRCDATVGGDLRQLIPWLPVLPVLLVMSTRAPHVTKVRFTSWSRDGDTNRWTFQSIAESWTWTSVKKGLRVEFEERPQSEVWRKASEWGVKKGLRGGVRRKACEWGVMKSLRMGRNERPQNGVWWKAFACGVKKGLRVVCDERPHNGVWRKASGPQSGCKERPQSGVQQQQDVLFPPGQVQLTTLWLLVSSPSASPISSEQWSGETGLS